MKLTDYFLSTTHTDRINSFCDDISSPEVQVNTFLRFNRLMVLANPFNFPLEQVDLPLNVWDLIILSHIDFLEEYRKGQIPKKTELTLNQFGGLGYALEQENSESIHSDDLKRFAAWFENRASIGLKRFNEIYRPDDTKLPHEMWVYFFSVFSSENDIWDGYSVKLEPVIDTQSDLTAAYDYIRGFLIEHPYRRFVEPAASSTFTSQFEMYKAYVGMVHHYAEYLYDSNYVRDVLICRKAMLELIHPDNLTSECTNIDSDKFYNACADKYSKCDCDEPIRGKDRDVLAIDLSTPFRGRESSRFIVETCTCKRCGDVLTFGSQFGSFNTSTRAALFDAANIKLKQMGHGLKLTPETDFKGAGIKTTLLELNQ